MITVCDVDWQVFGVVIWLIMIRRHRLRHKAPCGKKLEYVEEA